MEESLRPSAEPSDEALVIRVAQGDVAAFTLLYDRYARPVYSLAVHLLGQGEAEDVVQEVFLRLWGKARTFEEQRGSFRAWFMATARHRVLNELRSRRSRHLWQRVEEIDRLLAQAPDPAPDVEEQTWIHQRQKAVLHGLRSLPPEQRLALVLAYFGGLSQSAIAQHLSWPLGTVKKRVRLGLQKLRVSLQQQGLTPEAQETPKRHQEE